MDARGAYLLCYCAVGNQFVCCPPQCIPKVTWIRPGLTKQLTTPDIRAPYLGCAPNSHGACDTRLHQYHHGRTWATQWCPYGTRSYVTLFYGFVVGWGVWAARAMIQAMVTPVAWGPLFCDALGQDLQGVALVVPASCRAHLMPDCWGL